MAGQEWLAERFEENRSRLGAVWAPGGRLSRVLRFTMKDGKIAQIEIFADPVRLDALRLAVLPD